ncbi:hypothetical protein ElyMa_006669200 [Elysia marginata]|uniref:Uncharacterized protein n=1 Tax=Elysia marginata TaxID=1093978 RepID=A0AAV4IML8_9GAST|nr:hypothetical protein ElyMa_006669200 [Elysia marginata]
MKEVVARTGTLSMFSLLTNTQLRWLGHITPMQGGRMPKDVLYGKLTTGSRPIGKSYTPLLRHRLRLRPQGGPYLTSRVRSSRSGPQCLVASCH